MAEKTYITEKYVRCTCKKHQEILVGTKYSKYANIFLLLAIPLFIVALVVNMSKGWYVLVIAIGLLSLLVSVPRSLYKGAKKTMLEAGHSENCARRIGGLVVWHNGAHSDFKIMNGEKE